MFLFIHDKELYNTSPTNIMTVKQINKLIAAVTVAGLHLEEDDNYGQIVIYTNLKWNKDNTKIVNMTEKDFED